MRASDFVQTEAARNASAERLIQTETTDAVNSGLVGSADKSGMALKEGLYSVDRSRVALTDQNLRGKARVSYGITDGSSADMAGLNATERIDAKIKQQAQAAAGKRVRVKRLYGSVQDEEMGLVDVTDSLRDEVKEIYKRRRLKGGAAAVAGSAVHSTLQDSELEGADDLYYKGKGAVNLARRAKRRLSGKDALRSKKKLGKLSEKGYEKKKAAETAADIQRRAQTRRYMHRSVQASAKASAARKGGVTALLGSGGGSGGLLAAAGGGLGVFFLGILAIIIAIVVIAGASSSLQNENSSGMTIEIPEPYGTVFTITGYDWQGWAYFDSHRNLTHHKSVNSSTMQKTVWDEWRAAGCVYTSGIATTNGRFLIACTTTFGDVGDLVDFYLSDGTVLHCLIADTKNPNDAGCNTYGHDNGRCVVEFEVDPAYYTAYGNPGISSGWYIAGYPGINDGTTRTTKCVNLSRGGDTGGMGIPRMYQQDYAYVSYGSGTISSCGCGITSGAMVASYLTGQTITPADIINWCGNTYYVWGSGTSWSFFPALANHYGFTFVKQTYSIDEVYDALQAGQPVISSQRAGIFTSGGHLICLSGTDGNGGIYVNDPNKNNAENKGYNNRAFSKSEIDASANTYFIFTR